MLRINFVLDSVVSIGIVDGMKKKEILIDNDKKRIEQLRIKQSITIV